MEEIKALLKEFVELDVFIRRAFSPHNYCVLCEAYWDDDDPSKKHHKDDCLIKRAENALADSEKRKYG